MIKKTLILTALAAAAFPGAAHPAWERVRSSDAPLAAISVSVSSINVDGSTSTFETSYSAGETCAALSPSVSGADSVFSGYFSIIPYTPPAQGFFGFTSTNGVTMEGALWGAKADDGIKLLFSTEISSTLSKPGLIVTRLIDNAGQEVDEPWTSPANYTISYSSAQMIVVPTTAWPKGSVFSVRYSSYVVDINGYPVSGGTTVFFTVRMDHQTANTITALADRNAKVTVPANAYQDDFYLTLSTSSAGDDVKDANAGLASLPGAPQFLGELNISPYDAAGHPAQPGAACLVTMPYKDSNNDGVVEGGIGRIKASSLSVWRMDETRKLWVRQAGPAVDSASRQVSQSVDHFSKYALLGLPDTDLTAVYVFPVPFRPNAGDTARYGSWATGITFTNLPLYGKIKIYTISGELVRSLAVTPPQVVWDVKNTGGETVASGVYIWEIVSGKNRKTGKLIVVK